MRTKNGKIVSLTFAEAKAMKNNPPSNLSADVKDLLNTMRKVENGN